MARSKIPAKTEPSRANTRDRKLSLYGLSIEDALRAAAKTGRPDPLPKSTRANRQRKKRSESERGVKMPGFPG
jgi:hypothetical protein